MLSDSLARSSNNFLTRYVYKLSSSVYVHAVILLGDPDNDFENSRDWYVRAGINPVSALLNPTYAGYQNKSNRFGVEIKIESLAD
jgi:hypothetical protein